MSQLLLNAMPERQPQLPCSGRAISFEEFMAFCLYHPESGYYRRVQPPVLGKKGDFLTSPHTHPVFGQLVGRALATYLGRLRGEGELYLIELGAGDQALARVLLPWLQSKRPELASRLRYVPVDIEQSDLPEGVRGVVFSNEFFDALPVHRVRVREGRLFEIEVIQEQGRIRELSDRPARPEIVDYMQRAFSRWNEGWAYEVNLQMLQAVRRIDRSLSQGSIVTVDYGYREKEYDDVDRPEGTLMCYRRHQAYTDPYRHIGEQDMTTHVHFDLLERAGRDLGWSSEPLISQRDFLFKWGLEEWLIAEEKSGWFRQERLPDRLDLKALLAPGGLSDTLRVLVQHKPAL